MNYHTPHDEWTAKIVARASGDLSPAESILLDRHLLACPACMQTMEEFILLLNRLHPLQQVPSQPALPPAMLALKREIVLSVEKDVQRRIQEEVEAIIKESFA